MSFFSRGKLKIVLKDVAKKSAPTRKKSGKKQTPGGSKKESSKKTVMKSKMKAVIPKIHQEKALPQRTQKGKGKTVNSSAPSDMEIETETSAETEIHNDSIDLSTKEYFSEGKKEVNGAVEKQSNHSDLKKEPKKTKDSCFDREQKIKGHIKPCSKKKSWDLIRTVVNQSHKQIQKQGIILKLKYHFKEKLKKKEEWNHQSHHFNHL